MEFQLDNQVLRPIKNEVEVSNGEYYRDVVLQPRIKPLLEAKTVQQLSDVLDPVKQSLETFGAEPRFLFKKGTVGTQNEEISSMRTVVDLTHVRPDHSFELSSRVSRDLYNLEGKWKASNRFGLGELSELSVQTQPNPYSLAAGSASITTPMPSGRGLFQSKGFFFNEDRKWASHSLASHGLLADLRVPWIANFVFRGGAQAVARNVHSISEQASDVVRAAAGSSSLKVSAIAEITNKGRFHFARAFFEAAGAPGDAQHSKSVAQVDYDFPISPGQELVLSSNGRAGYIHSDDDKPKLCDNFLIGGPQDVLGFKRFSSGPRDSSDFIGGQAFYTSRVASLGKIPFKPSTPLRLKTQIDAGVSRSHSSVGWRNNLKGLLTETAALSTAAGLTYSNEKAKFDVLWVVPVRSATTDVRHGGSHVSAELNLL